MKPVILQEGVRYRITDLVPRFGSSETQIQEILARMDQFGILRRVGKLDSNIDLTYIFDITRLEGDRSDYSRGFYIFNFVGLMTIDDFVIEFYPKYIDLEFASPHDLRLILRVLERFISREQLLPEWDEEDGDQVINILPVTIFLIRDYFDHGEYVETRVCRDRNGSGEIDWGRTLDGSFYPDSSGSPVYIDIVTRKSHFNQDAFVTKVHRAVLMDIEQRITSARLHETLDFPHIDLGADFEPLSSLGVLEFVLSRLNQELASVFLTREQTLIRALISYIRCVHVSEDAESVGLWGSSSFHVVWEAVCRSVLGSDLNSSLEALGIVPPEGSKYTPEQTLFSVIEKPKWVGFDEDGDFTVSGVDSLIPDIVKLDASGNGLSLIILDAKYYKVEMARGFSATGFPGMGDVSKQHLYEAAFEEFAREHKVFSIINCFLFPSDGLEVECFGSASLGFLTERGLSNIRLFHIPARVLYESYLRRESMGISALVS